MCVLVVIRARVLMAVMRVMFVRAGVWVGVTQLAVTVQIARDELIGCGGHGQVSVERVYIGGLDR